MRAVLTIAGSDSIAGAGIQADLKTFAALGVYGTAAITAVTSQNSSTILDILAMPAEMVRSQIEAVAADIALSAVKTGMLATADIARVVADALATLNAPFLVVDPVWAAGNPGRRTLLSAQGVEALMARIVPKATVVTPNAAEAAVLAGIEVRSLSDAREAARKIFGVVGAAVLVKGGHLDGGAATDVLFDGRTVTEYSSPRLPYRSVHGTGCTLASGIAAGLALGDNLPEAIQRAKTYVTGAIEHSFEAGHGSRLLNHFWLYTR